MSKEQIKVTARAATLDERREIDERRKVTRPCDGCDSPPDNRRWMATDGTTLCYSCETAKGGAA